MTANSGLPSKRTANLYTLSYDPLTNSLGDSQPAKKVSDRREEELIVAAERLGLLTRSDVIGCLHWLPRGVVVRELILAVASELMRKVDARLLDLSSLFRISSLADVTEKLLEKFSGGIMTVADLAERRYLRYASDPMLFKLLAGRRIMTPNRTYSPGYFYREEQSGNVKPLTRPREFYMTDFHFFANRQSDLSEFQQGALLNLEAMQYWLPSDRWYIAVDTNEPFFEKEKHAIIAILQKLGVFAQIHVTRSTTHYYDLQFQYQANYFSGNWTQIANLQLDRVNGNRFGILHRVTAEPVSVVHGTLFGRVEKILAVLLGLALEQSASVKPRLPTWISPVAVRILIIPCEASSNNLQALLTKRLREAGIRFDVDTRDLPIGKRVRQAEQHWVPYVITIGERELQTGKLRLRNRATGSETDITLESFLRLLEAEFAGRPKTETRLAEQFSGELW